MYVDYEFYKKLYGSDAVSESEFNRFSWDASKKIEHYTTGVDGVKKLQVAFPTDDGAESVKRCVCALIDLMSKIKQAEHNLHSATGFIQKEDGTVQGKVVTSVSAGNESISYSAKTNNTSPVDEAVSDRTKREQLFADTIREYLSGVSDANGVNLLYMGTYPYAVKG
jgi:hypothetical protein